MTMLAAAVRSVKTTRSRPSPARLARALDAALGRLRDLLPDFHVHPGRSQARGRWLERTWWPATEAADRAEAAVLAEMRRRGAKGFVAGGRLFLDFAASADDLDEYRPPALLAVSLADVPDLVLRRPAALDWPEWTDDDVWNPADDDAPADEPTDDDRAWWAGQHDDGEGLTEREAERLDVEHRTVSALDWLLDSIDDRAEEAAAQDRYERCCLPV